MADLKVCKRCGWYEHSKFGGETCTPERGAAADRLAKAIAVPSTKLGYGHGMLTFKFSETFSVTLDVHKDGTFTVERVWILGYMNETSAIAFINALAAASKTLATLATVPEAP